MAKLKKIFDYLNVLTKILKKYDINISDFINFAFFLKKSRSNLLRLLQYLKKIQSVYFSMESNSTSKISTENGLIVP